MSQESGVGSYTEPPLTIVGGTLYGAVEKRVVAVHRPGMVNATRNLLGHFAQDPDGPILLPACERVSGKAVEDGIRGHENEEAYNSRAAEAVRIEVERSVLRADGG